MKKVFTLLFLITSFPSFAKVNDQQAAKESRQYHLGPKGGCYYLKLNNDKVYVDRKLCQ